MQFVPLIVAGLSTATAGYSAYQSYEAGQDADDRADAAAAAEAAATEEEAARLEEENARTQSLARAKAAASGVGGSTTSTYLAELEASGIEEVDWLKQVGASKYQSILAEGESAVDTAMASFWGDVGATAVSAVETGQAYSLWGQTP